MKRCLLDIYKKPEVVDSVETLCGKVELISILRATRYHSFVDEIALTHPWLKDSFLEGYKDERLYALYSNEHTPGTLPCIALVSKNRKDTIEFIWTQPEYCCKGLATALLKLLKIKYAVGAIPSPFWVKRGITLLHGFKPSYNTILCGDNELDDGRTHLFDDPYDSSEEEPQDDDALAKNISYKMWLVNEITQVGDIATSVASLIYWFHTHIEFKCIIPEYEDSLYGVMSEARVRKQLGKTATYAKVVGCYDDNWRMYGQFMTGINHIVRNRTMSIMRYYRHYHDHREDEDEEEEASYDAYREKNEASLSEAIPVAKSYDLYTYLGSFTNEEGTGSFLLLMDNGINRSHAIAFAHKAVLDEYLLQDLH